MSDELYDTERATLHSLMDTALVLDGNWPDLAEWQRQAKHVPLPSLMKDGRWKP